MIHDIGKVGVSDLILKKTGLLTPEERAIMCSHTYLGASLFDKVGSDITDLAQETILHHHQKWDGSGYSGNPAVPTLAGKAIPLAARLTAIADVFDALVSPRCYKKPWSFNEARNLIKKEAGHHFDPELAMCFLDLCDLVKTIYTRYPDFPPE
jgi:response regulator RpfG family c-di-GMP phosphodiesterase